MKTILIFIVCFIAGTALSVGWRMTMQDSAAIPVENTTAAPIANAPAPAASTNALKTVYGRQESIAGLSAALAAPTGSMAAEKMNDWAKRLSVTDAFLACEMLLKSPRTDARDFALRQSLLEAAKTEPFRAYDILSKLGVTGPYDNTRQRLIASMTSKNPKQTWDTLSAAGGSISKLDVESIAKEWGRTQGYGSATFGLALRDPIQRATYLRQALPAWIAEDTVSFAKWFQQQPAEFLLERYVSFNSIPSNKTLTLASLDAAVALNLPVDSSSLESAFASAWKTPAMLEQAPAWIALQLDQDVRDAAWKMLAHEFISSDIASATELLPRIQNEKTRRGVSSTIAAEMAKADPLGAMNFATTLTDENARSKAQASALATWAKHQPVESLAYAREHAASLPLEFLYSPASDWGKTNPAGTIEFLGSVPKEGKEDYTLKYVASEWNKRRPDEVEAWLAKASPGRAKDAVVSERNKPVENSKSSGLTSYGPNGLITDIKYGEPGKRSTSTTINGRTAKYYY